MALIQIWMCGGSLEIHPCSHVGHIFRTTSPHKWDVPNGGLHPVKRNAMRVAEVWLDEYRLFYYERSNYPIVGINQSVARPSSRQVSHHSQSSSCPRLWPRCPITPIHKSPNFFQCRRTASIN